MFFRKLNLKSDAQFEENHENKFSNYNILKNLKLKQFQLNTINKMKVIENYYYNDKDFVFKNKVGFLSDPVFTGKSFSKCSFISFQTSRSSSLPTVPRTWTSIISFATLVITLFRKSYIFCSICFNIGSNKLPNVGILGKENRQH